jgi:Methyltransferase domain
MRAKVRSTSLKNRSASPGCSSSYHRAASSRSASASGRTTVWAPVYDALVGAVGFTNARRHSIERLGLEDGDRVLIVGAGTGLDPGFVPPSVAITAIDVTPAMLRRLARRAAHAGRLVSAQVMDAGKLTFPDASFDAVIMHLILAVVPQPELGLRADFHKYGGIRPAMHPASRRCSSVKYSR